MTDLTDTIQTPYVIEQIRVLSLFLHLEIWCQCSKRRVNFINNVRISHSKCFTEHLWNGKHLARCF